MADTFRKINKVLSEEDILMLNPLHLAYIGDGIYELFIRTYLLDGKMSVNEMNKKARSLVNAETQALVSQLIMDHLNEKEERIFKRGRNAKTSSSPKNMKIMDYKHATGLEALLGYLYLKQSDERLLELMNKILYEDIIFHLEIEILNTKNIDKKDVEKDFLNLLNKYSIEVEGFYIDEFEKDLKIDLNIPLLLIDYVDLKKTLYRFLAEYKKREDINLNLRRSLQFKEDINEG